MIHLFLAVLIILRTLHDHCLKRTGLGLLKNNNTMLLPVLTFTQNISDVLRNALLIANAISANIVQTK
jgi:hypothetical protein